MGGYGRVQVSGQAPVGQGYGAFGGAAPLVELAMRALGGGSRATYNPPVSEEAAAALGAARRPATGSKPMRDYLGNEVQGAMDVIRALAPPPAPVAALGAPMPGKRSGGMVRGRGDGRSDSVPGVVLGRGRAMDAVAVSDGEYVIPADAVSALGRGSSDAGARKLDRMVEETRAGYRAHLGRIPEPRKGGKRKFLGGLFENKQESEIVQPTWARELGGAGKEILLNNLGKRSSEDGVAKFDQNQLDAFGLMRSIAKNDPGGAQKGIAQSRGHVDAQQGRVGGAQDYLASVFGQGGWSDKLVDDSLADFDYQRSKDVAAANRARAGRGAFGERRAIAEDEESVASNLSRAKLGSSLREQGLNQRMAAATGMGNLARTGGDLANLGAGLATTQRDVQVGNAGLLNQVGSAIQGRNQQILDDPYRKVDAYRGFMSGAPSATNTTTQQSPLQTLLGVGLTAGGMFLRDGGKVRLGRSTRRRYALGGPVVGPALGAPVDAMPSWMMAMRAQPMPMPALGRAPAASGMLSGPTPDWRAAAPAGMLRGGAPNLPSVDPSAFTPGAAGAARVAQPGNVGPMPGAGGGIQAQPMPVLGRPQPAPAMGMVGPAPGAAFGAAPAGMFRSGPPVLPGVGGTALQPGGIGAAKAAQPAVLGRGPMANVGAAPPPAAGVSNEIAMKQARLGAINGGRGMPQLPAPVGMPMQRSPLLRGFADGGLMGEDEPEFPEPGWLGAKLGMRPLFRETIPDALGMNYEGPDPRMPGSLEKRYMKARPTLGAVDTGDSAAVAAPVKTSVADKVKAVLGSGTPKPKARAPMADVERDRSGPVPVPASKPEPQPSKLGQPRFANNFMPEMKTGAAHDAPAQAAATQGGAAEGKSWKDRLGDGLTNPLTLAGLALLSSNAPNLGAALGEAGLTAARAVGERKRQEKEDARQAKEDAWTERKMGLDEQTLQATLGNQKALAESRAADDRRADAAAAALGDYRNQQLGVSRANAVETRRYHDEQIGLGRANLKRLQDQGLAGGKKLSVLDRTVIQGLGQKLVEAQASGDTNAENAIRQQLLAMGAMSDNPNVSLLPAGAGMDEEE